MEKDKSQENEQVESCSIYLFGDINRDTIEDTIMPLIECLDEGIPVKLYISTDGGDSTVAMVLADIIDRSETPIDVYLLGEVLSAGFVVALSGYKNEQVHTYAYPSTRVMWHSGHVSGFDSSVSVPSLDDYATHLRKDWNRLCSFIKEHSCMTDEQISDCYKRDRWFFPEEMLQLGIIDEIL